MRVMHFRTVCDTGGVSTWMRMLSSELRERGVESSFFFVRSVSRAAELAEVGRVRVGSFAQLVGVLGAGGLDVVHVTSGDPLASRVAAHASDARVVVTSHGGLAEGWRSGNCVAYTAVSRQMAEFNQPSTDVAIDAIINGVDRNLFSPPPAPAAGAPVVAFIGRATSPVKDFPRFTRIASLLARAGARIWVADAHAASPDALRALGAVDVPIERWVNLRHGEMPEFYRAIAASGGALLMTSRHEGLPYVAVEAGASGVPTFAPDRTGMREVIVPGASGALYPADASDAAVADLVLASLGTGAGWSDRAHACAEAVAARFDVKVMADRYLEVYRREAPVLRSTPAVAVAAPELAPLRENLLWQRRNRARWNAMVALELAQAGMPAAALGALGCAARADLRTLLRGSGARQSAETIARVIRRPGRLMRPALPPPLAEA